MPSRNAVEMLRLLRERADVDRVGDDADADADMAVLRWAVERIDALTAERDALQTALAATHRLHAEQEAMRRDVTPY